MKIVPTFFFAGLLVFIVTACQKPVNNDITGPGKGKLLTEKMWRLISYGRDANNDGLIDPTEEAIRNCEKDNSYSFVIDGSGLVNENSDICPGRSVSGSFHWSFVNNETGLNFIDGVAIIVKLNETSMILSNQDASQRRLILMYSH